MWGERQRLEFCNLKAQNTKDFWKPLEEGERAWLCQYFDFELAASRTVNEANQVYGTLFSTTRKQIESRGQQLLNAGPHIPYPRTSQCPASHGCPVTLNPSTPASLAALTFLFSKVTLLTEGPSPSITIPPSTKTRAPHLATLLASSFSL